jgi:hypothetical protein
VKTWRERYGLDPAYQRWRRWILPEIGTEPRGAESLTQAGEADKQRTDSPIAAGFGALDGPTSHHSRGQGAVRKRAVLRERADRAWGLSSFE